MGVAVAVARRELTSAQLRPAACASEDPTQIRRLLAIALVLEGVPRQQAAEQCGMDRQTLRLAAVPPTGAPLQRGGCCRPALASQPRPCPAADAGADICAAGPGGGRA